MGRGKKPAIHIYLVAVFRAARAAMSGRFEDSERLAQQAFTIGQRVQTEAASGIFGLQMFALRRQQGRLKEVEPVVGSLSSRILRPPPGVPVWR